MLLVIFKFTVDTYIPLSSSPSFIQLLIASLRFLTPFVSVTSALPMFRTVVRQDKFESKSPYRSICSEQGIGTWVPIQNIYQGCNYICKNLNSLCYPTCVLILFTFSSFRLSFHLKKESSKSFRIRIMH